MDESEVQQIARRFVAKVNTSNIQNDLSAYLDEINAKIQYDELAKGESGYTLEIKGQPRITINSLENEERQRFTICHEIAHVVLRLPSNHDEVPSWAYAKRDFNETLCDMFAAELLMPYETFKAKIPVEEPSAEVIEYLASEFNTSFPAAGSRLAALTDIPCAFVTIDRGIIRYASRSTSLRKAQAWIAPKTTLANGSIAYSLRAAGVNQTDTGEVSQDIWFVDWPKGSDLWEMSRHYARFDQTVSLLWFDEEDLPDIDVPRFQRNSFRDEGLSELTGELPWPGRKRRRP